MGLISFGRNFVIGKPSSIELVRQWYWFEEALWRQRFLDAAALKSPLSPFDFPFTDEDFEMTDRLNCGMRHLFPQLNKRIPARTAFVRSKRIDNFGGGPMYYTFCTANPDTDVDLMMATQTYVTASIKAEFEFLSTVMSKYGRPVNDSRLLLSQIKKDGFIFNKPGLYFRLQADAFGDNLQYKQAGKREEIRKGFFRFLCSRDRDVIARRLDAGESGYIIPLYMYNWLEGHVLEGRRKE